MKIYSIHSSDVVVSCRVFRSHFQSTLLHTTTSKNFHHHRRIPSTQHKAPDPTSKLSQQSFEPEIMWSLAVVVVESTTHSSEYRGHRQRASWAFSTIQNPRVKIEGKKREMSFAWKISNWKHWMEEKLSRRLYICLFTEIFHYIVVTSAHLRGKRGKSNREGNFHHSPAREKKPGKIEKKKTQEMKMKRYKKRYRRVQ